LESKIQAKIIKYLTANGFYNNKSIRMSRAGLPDVLTVKSGITYFFEVKQPGGVVSPLQQITMSKLNQHKQIAFVVYSFDQFKKIWESL
jgi:Holliday junction resolvase